MGVGVSVLTYLWYRYLNRTEEEPMPRIGDVLWISAICCVFIGIGLSELVRSSASVGGQIYGSIPNT
jgi:uncharacterized membrane-anchored protein YitT (DUF2179 family)